jgi:hypothetical protein
MLSRQPLHEKQLENLVCKILKLYDYDYDTIFKIKNYYHDHIKLRRIVYFILKTKYGCNHKMIARICQADRANVVRAIRRASAHSNEIIEVLEKIR